MSDIEEEILKLAGMEVLESRWEKMNIEEPKINFDLFKNGMDGTYRMQDQILKETQIVNNTNTHVNLDEKLKEIKFGMCQKIAQCKSGETITWNRVPRDMCPLYSAVEFSYEANEKTGKHLIRVTSLTERKEASPVKKPVVKDEKIIAKYMFLFTVEIPKRLYLKDCTENGNVNNITCANPNMVEKICGRSDARVQNFVFFVERKESKYTVTRKLTSTKITEIQGEKTDIELIEESSKTFTISDQDDIFFDTFASFCIDKKTYRNVATQRAIQIRDKFYLPSE